MSNTDTNNKETNSEVITHPNRARNSYIQRQKVALAPKTSRCIRKESERLIYFDLYVEQHF